MATFNSTNVNGNTKNQIVSSPTTITTDVDIVPVNQSIDPSNYIYDGQTILMINSTINQNSNLVKAQYFDPVNGSSERYGSSGFSDWSFNLTPKSYLNGVMSASSLLGDTTTLYNNLQPLNNALGTYTLDVTDGGLTTAGSSDGVGTSYETCFFSLTSYPYVTERGYFTDSSVKQPYGEPTYTNVNPNYSTNNSDNFIFTSNYYTQQKNEILIVQLVFTVSNTNSLNVLTSSSSSTPSVSVIVYNKVISQDNMASIANNNPSKTKIYTAGPIPLQYMQAGSAFNPSNGNYSINNNVPIIIADGYQKLYATLPLIYVPPVKGSSGTYYGQYLNCGTSKDSTTLENNGGYYISNNLPTVPISGTQLNVTSLTDDSQIVFGHFVVGIAYSTDFASYNPGSTIYSEILIKNIWRSPITIYSSYNAFSVNDMATKLVVVLFGKTLNGGTFLVTNTGTPLSLINNYGVTSLRNFMTIMNAVTTTFDGSTSLVDYFINVNVIDKINSLGFNIQPLTLQPLLDGAITNPPTVLACPNMYYLLLNSVNSVNMTVDPTKQIVFGQSISQPYFGLDNSILCSTGVASYYNSTLNMLSTNNKKYLFANSLYLGVTTINNQSFYTLLILPEALFNGVPTNLSPNVLSVYSTVNSLFYLVANNNSSTQFSPDQYSISTSTTVTSKPTVTPNYLISKIVLSASNV
jgi:hypothetical protein